MEMLNIFSPRKAFAVVDKKAGTVKQVDYISPVGIKEFDKYYVDYNVKQVPVPICEGSEDYVLELRITESKRSIQETIDSQVKMGVGLDAMLEKFKRTGDPSVLPQPVQATDEIVDFTKLPQDNAEYFEYIHGIAAAYEKLPIELRKDMTAEEFVKNVTEKQVNDYIKSITPKEENKDE